MTRRALKTAEVTKVDQLCEVGRRSTNSTAQGRARHDRRTRREPTQERRRRSVTRGGGEAAPLQHIRGVTPRTRTGAAVPCSRGRRNRRLVDCRNHGRELSTNCPAVALFPRRTKATRLTRAAAAWRQFSGFSPRRFGVFHDTNTLEVP